jgi:hypothetical protein
MLKVTENVNRDDRVHIRYPREETEMNIDYLLLCGVMWAQHASEDACEELIRALHSDEPDVALLANALLKGPQRVATA